MIEQADFYIRLISIGASLMLLALLVEGEMRKGLKVTLVGLVISTITYVINSTPALEPSGWADGIINLIAMAAPFWVWIFARRLFEREPRAWAVRGAIIGYLVTWAVAVLIEPMASLTFHVNRAISLILIIDLVRVGIMERADDLVEKRRVIRLVLPLLIAAQAALILLFEIVFGQTSAFPFFQLINGVLILLITLFSGIALLRTDPELLVEVETETALQEDVAAIDLSPSEQVLHDKLKEAMASGAYRETGLSITALAEQLDTPEHRLRALINRKLGHRNFSAFLNRHRIAEARKKLSDPDDVDLPVLTIAMDLGYNSLPTFNRAFRAETGTTPSEYRRLAFENSGGGTGQN